MHAKQPREDDTLVNRVLNTILPKASTKIDPKTLPKMGPLWGDDNAIASSKDVFKAQDDIITQITLRLENFAKVEKRNVGRQLDSFMSTLMGRIDESLKGSDSVVLQEVAALRRVVLEMKALWTEDAAKNTAVLEDIKSKLGELYLEDC